MTPLRAIVFCVLVVPLAAQSPPAAAPAPAAPGRDHEPLAALAALPVRPPVDRGVRVVVRGADGAPAADAVVVFVAYDDPRHAASADEARRRFAGDELAYHALRLASGTRHAVDERGATRVAATDGRVLACRGGVVASSTIDVEDGKPLPRVELELKPAVSFAVVVVDANGQPAADAQVGIVTPPGRTAFPRCATGADGVATFRLLPTRGADARVRLLVPTKERREVPLPLPGERASFQLPECGTVTVALGGEVLPGSTVAWSLVRDDRRFAPTSSEARSATFRHVEAGFEGKVQASYDGITQDARVPAVTAGETSDVALVRADGRSLVLRVLDADGAPAKSCLVSTSWRHQHGSTVSSARTNPEGWLELQLPDGARGDVELRLMLLGRSWDDGASGTLTLKLGDADQGRVQRGEQRCTRVPPALVGVAVDAEGEPNAGVQLTAQHDAAFRTKTGADGRFTFAIPGDKPPSLLLSLTPAWYFTEPTSRARTVDTAAEARLVLQPAGRLRFDAPGLPDDVANDFDLRLEPVSSGGERIDLDLTLDAGELLLPAGHWSVVVLEGEREIHRIDGVRVDAGVEVHDPRFMAFDWRAFAALVTIRVEHRDGKPTDACTVWRQYGSRGSGRRPAGGVSQWLVPADGGAMRVEPEDQNIATVQLGTVTGEHVVRLGSGPRLQVALSRLPRVPAGAKLMLHVDDHHEGVPFDDHGTAALWLPEPGEHHVALSVCIGHARHMLPGDPQACEVPAAGHTLRIPVTDALQQAIDRAAEQLQRR